MLLVTFSFVLGGFSSASVSVSSRTLFALHAVDVYAVEFIIFSGFGNFSYSRTDFSASFSSSTFLVSFLTKRFLTWNSSWYVT